MRGDEFSSIIISANRIASEALRQGLTLGRNSGLRAAILVVSAAGQTKLAEDIARMINTEADDV